MNKIELGEMIGGALQEKFSNSFERVIENLQDQNTPFKDKRNITIKLVFEQNEARDDVSVKIDISEKLAAQCGMKTSFSIGKDLRTGEIFAEEYGKQLKGQLVMNSVPAEKGVGEVPCDPETGEVLEEPKNNVVDLRIAK
jgi:hypothetical protein